MQGSSRTRAYYDFRYGVAVGEFESIGSVVGSATLVAVEEMTLRGPSPSVLPDIRANCSRKPTYWQACSIEAMFSLELSSSHAPRNSGRLVLLVDSVSG